MKPIIKMLVVLLSISVLAAACKKAVNKEEPSMKQLLTETVLQQFGKIDFSIENVQYETHRNNQFATVSYVTSKGQRSTALIVTLSGDPITVDAHVLDAHKTYIIDCRGSCGCTEKYIPSSNSVECTCTPCQMKITEIINN